MIKNNSEVYKTMEKITSFTIDHIKLQPGLYVSRKDKVGGETVTTFDLRCFFPDLPDSKKGQIPPAAEEGKGKRTHSSLKCSGR